MGLTENFPDFVVKPVYSGKGASEFRQSMIPHPMVSQELPHDPVFGVYNRRLRSLEYGKVSTVDLYWRLRRQVGLSHTGELATEVSGPGSEALLNRVFTRDVSRVRLGRCSYQIACFSDGGVIMDGVLLRLGPERFWYVQGDGEFPVWLRAHSDGYDVEILDAGVWVSQVQGPLSMRVLAEVADEGMPESFRYFDLASIRIDRQPVVISRTGFTGELGWEFYFGSDADADVIANRLMQIGEQYGIHTIPAAATNARRIEAGLLFAGTDFDQKVTPYAAGLGALVDLRKTCFIGKAALEKVDKTRLTWGLQCKGGIARHGQSIFLDDEPVGRVCSSAWSPYLQRGVAIVRLQDAVLGPGSVLRVECIDGQRRSGEVCELPMYDPAGEIPRGKTIDVPELPDDR